MVHVGKGLNLAKKIILNAKMRRTSICGAVETLLIDNKALKSHAIDIINSLKKSGCEVRVDKKINKLYDNKLKMAKEKGSYGSALHCNFCGKSQREVKKLIASEDTRKTLFLNISLVSLIIKSSNSFAKTGDKLDVAISKNGKVMGTYIHGLFSEDNFFSTKA